MRAFPGATVVDTPELVITDSGLTCDTFNVVCRARLSVERAPTRVAAAVARFRSAKRPFSWWAGPADQPRDLARLLEDQGLAHAETELTMFADLLADKAPDPAPGGLDVRRVRTLAELRDFAEAVSYGSPDGDEIVRLYTGAGPSLLSDGSPQRFYVGYLNGDPVATVELTVGAGVVGLYGIATREEFRRRGFGTAMTAHAMREGQSLGFGTAILQATAAGAGVYAHLGFSAYGEVREYKP